MAGNIIGSFFRVTTWGESHGEALGAVVDGCPPGINLDTKDIQEALDRRRPSGVVSSTTRKEADKVEILSGVFEGKTTGTPISLLIKNSGADPSAYHELKDIFRPGQGDFTYLQKYGLRLLQYLLTMPFAIRIRNRHLKFYRRLLAVIIPA